MHYRYNLGENYMYTKFYNSVSWTRPNSVQHTAISQVNDFGYVVRYGIVNRWSQKNSGKLHPGTSILLRNHTPGTPRPIPCSKSIATVPRVPRTSFLMNMDGWEWSFLQFCFCAQLLTKPYHMTKIVEFLFHLLASSALSKVSRPRTLRSS